MALCCLLLLAPIWAFSTGASIAAICLFAIGLASGAIAWLRNEGQESKIESALVSGNSIVIATDRDGLVSYFNATAEHLLGYSADEVRGILQPKAFHAWAHTDVHVESDEPDATTAHGDSSHLELMYVRKDGTSFPAIVTIAPIRDASGDVVGHLEIGVDITDRESRRELLSEKQELIESIALISPTIFYIFDLAERRIVYTNRQLASLLGYSEGQIAHMGADPLPAVMHPEDLDILFNRYVSCASLRDGEVLEIEFRCLTADGELRWLQARDVVFKRDEEGNPSQILVSVVDATERKILSEQIEGQVLEIQDTNLALEIQTNALEEANARLEALAFTDGLTGIANHRSFQEELAKTFEVAKRRKKRLSLMLLDVDKFKQYNDTYGHPSGDIVLKRVAACIRDACPEGCTPARYGGEEFAVICPDFSANEALTLAERIRESIEKTPWPERSVTVSIGAVNLTAEITSPSELVSASDTALYSSKASGRNCVTFYDVQKRRLAS